MTDIEARDFGAVQQVIPRGSRFSLKMAMSTLATPTSFLPEDCTWNTGALEHTLEAQRGLHLAVLVVRQSGRGCDPGVSFSESLSLAEVRTAGPQDLAHLRGIEDGQQQVLDRQELVASVTRLGEGVVQTEFELLAITPLQPLDR